MNVVTCAVPACEWESEPFAVTSPPPAVREDVVLHVWLEHPEVYLAAKEQEAGR